MTQCQDEFRILSGDSVGGPAGCPSVRAVRRSVRPSVRAGGRPNTRAACVTLPQCVQGLLPSNIYGLICPVQK